MTTEQARTRLDGVSVVYRSAAEQVVALDNVNVQIPDRGVLVVAGPSGSGKSTMLRLLAGFDRPTSGAVLVEGVELSALSERRRRRFRRRRVAVVHQRPLHNLLGELTAQQHVAFARQVRGVHTHPGERPHADVLATFGLHDRRDALVRHLSGGEQQRLAMAMALASGATVVVADEPTAELDRSHAHDVIRSLGELAGEGVTVVVASHDDELIAAFGSVVRVSDGRVVG